MNDLFLILLCVESLLNFFATILCFKTIIECLKEGFYGF